MGWLIVAACVLLAAAAAIRIFNILEGANFILDLWDEFVASRASLADLDRANASRTDRSQAIVSLTTIPSRLPFIDDTLKSLLRQTRPPAEIRLYIPTFSARENKPYDVPEHLRRLQSLKIVECDDFGPATKFIPALLSLPAGQMLIVVDDDRIYPRNLVADLEAAALEAPDAAYGLSGWVAPDDLIDRPTTIVTNFLMRPPVPIRAMRLRANRQVDILQGYSGYLIRPRFFDLDRLVDYTGTPPAAWTTDDVWVSAHCRVPKYVIPAKRSNFQAWGRTLFYKQTSLGRINSGATDAERKNTVMLQYFAGRWMNASRR